ncbi:hypothetical protein [Stutzerimonas stutzeri]|uniref:hypothetical protein n=1 Tax=Stutzerimonas stutzeri TaxID=316 RepID=UPI0024492D46|nr:hypothetical protein [Stutzerimonas stutzeri]MDH0427967.1 hypothetical protein [Stutzerimonas stutzeri]
MLISKRAIPLYLVIALILISLLDQIIPGARYAKYLVLPISAAMIFDKNLKIATPPSLQPFYLYLMVMAPYLALSILHQNNNSIDDIAFLLTYLLPLALIKSTRINLKSLFIATSILFLINSAGNFGSEFSIDLSTSTSSFEHSEFGFIFSFFLVYFAISKDYKLSAIALVLTVLSLKRIALLGAVIAIAVYHVNLERIISRNKIALIAASINVLAVALIKFSTTDYFNDLVFSLTEQSANQFMMGRVLLYSYILERTELNLFHGLGPGGVYSYASAAFESTSRVLLHSDTLKIAIEYGTVFLFTFMYLLYKDKRAPLEQVVLLNIIMLTDNPLIYSSVMFIFFLAIVNTRQPSQAAQQ